MDFYRRQSEAKLTRFSFAQQAVMCSCEKQALMKAIVKPALYRPEQGEPWLHSCLTKLHLGCSWIQLHCSSWGTETRNWSLLPIHCEPVPWIIRVASKIGFNLPTWVERRQVKAVCKAFSFLCTWFLGVNGYDVHTLSFSERTLWTGRPAAWTSASVDEAHPASFKKILT